MTMFEQYCAYLELCIAWVISVKLAWRNRKILIVEPYDELAISQTRNNSARRHTNGP